MSKAGLVMSQMMLANVYLFVLEAGSLCMRCVSVGVDGLLQHA